MAFLREAEDFLARLPSISLDVVDPLFPQANPALNKAQYPELFASKAGAADVTGQGCTITSGPQPFPRFNPNAQPKFSASAKPTSSTYSPNSPLIPLSSLESYSGAEGSGQRGAGCVDTMADDQTVLLQFNNASLQSRNSDQQSCESDAAEEYGLRRSPRNASSRKGKAPREKRKVGRPIAYCGDPDSPDLTPAERRRIKRRIANRESARRVRARRQDLIEEMAVKASEMEMHNSTLASHATAVELQHATMVRQMREYTARLQQTAEQNEALQREIAHLRGMLQSKAEEAGKADHSCPSSSSQSAPVNRSTTPDCMGAGPSPLGASANDFAATSGRHTQKPQNFGNGLRSAFASSSGLTAEVVPDMPGAGGAVMCSAASIDQLLPTLDNLGFSPSMAFPWDSSLAADKAPSFALEMF